jgi:hypothetical protein
MFYVLVIAGRSPKPGTAAIFIVSEIFWASLARSHHTNKERRGEGRGNHDCPEPCIYGVNPVFWQGFHQIYGHIRCINTVLTNPNNHAAGEATLSSFSYRGKGSWKQESDDLWTSGDAIYGQW